MLFDFESTGLFLDPRQYGEVPADDPRQPYIVSVYAAIIEKEGHPIRVVDRIVKPEGWTIPFDAARIHGITTEIAMEKGVPIADILDEFMALWDSVDIIASFNIWFDSKLARGALRRAGREDRFGEKAEYCVMLGSRGPCKLAPTDRMMAAGYYDNKPPKLAQACEILLGRKHEKAHTAAGDVLTTIDLYRWLANRGLVKPKRRESFKPISSRGPGPQPQPGRVSPETVPAAADPFGVAS
jgi:DNA polymerase III epsilon subunit-like protein